MTGTVAQALNISREKGGDMNYKMSPAAAVITMTSVTMLFVVILVIFAPTDRDVTSTIERLLTIAIPTTTALLAALSSSRNANQLVELHQKTDELKIEAAEAKEAATTVNTIVAEHLAPQVDSILPTVETIASDVKELKNGSSGHGSTPPYGHKMR
jgi:cellobiose-specific phosphotransferase system component IIB